MPESLSNQSREESIRASCSKLLVSSLQNFELVQIKGFADDNINVAEKLKFVFERVENFVGKGENASYQHFLLFPLFDG